MTPCLHAAAEEQVHGLGAIPANRRKCRLGCNADETAYHVTSACLVPAYNYRHDLIVYWVIKNIMEATSAPEETIANLQFAKATACTEYTWKKRRITIRAGMKVISDPKLHHNRPDIMVQMTHPDEVYVFEIAVSHLQNIRLQERIKEVRYSKNSTVPIDKNNVDTVERGTNLIETLEYMYRCPVHLEVLVFGTYGEVLYTEKYQAAQRALRTLGMSQNRLTILTERCATTAAKTSAQIILKRLARQPETTERGLQNTDSTTEHHDYQTN